MTLMSFGHAMPIHLDMLSLVGYESVERDMQPATTLNVRKLAMQSGLKSLRQITGVDFGYDPAMWREYLLDDDDDHGYQHPWAFAGVDAAILAALDDPDVVAAIDLMAQDDG